MNFYPISANSHEDFVYLLELSQTTILFVGGLSFQSFLHYLPFSKFFTEELDQHPITKKIQLSKEKFIETNPKEEKNPYYKKIDDDYFIKGPFKFDLFFLNYLDIAKIDYIFISSMEELLIFPFITSHPKFTAKIYSTLPIKQIGYYIVKEFYHMINFRNKQMILIPEDIGCYFEEINFFELFAEKYGIDIAEWVNIYSYEQIENCFSRIECLHYNEEILIKNNIIITPRSSGFNIGSCYWLIEKNNFKIAMFTNGCFHNYRHSSLIDLEPISEGKCDLLIIGNCINEKNIIEFESITGIVPSNAECLLKKLFENILTLSTEKNMNILMPVRNMVLMLDLLDILYNRFKDRNLKFFVISEALESMISYGNANVEYLNPILKNMIFESDPQNPFSSYDNLKKTGKIIFFNNIFEFQEQYHCDSIVNIISKNTPSLYIFIDSTMRFGPSIKFLEAFEEIGCKSTIIITDPYLQCKEVFNPFSEKFTSKICYSPIDSRFTLNDVKNNFIKKIMPKNVLLPKKYINKLQMFGMDENFFGFCEEEDVLLSQFTDKIEGKQNSVIKCEINLNSLKYINLDENNKYEINKAQIWFENEKIQSIDKINGEKYHILINLKKNEEIDKNIIENIIHVIANYANDYFLKEKNKIIINDYYYGFKLLFSNKKKNDFYFLIEHNYNKTYIWANNFQELEKIEEEIKEIFKKKFVIL